MNISAVELRDPCLWLAGHEVSLCQGSSAAWEFEPLWFSAIRRDQWAERPDARILAFVAPHQDENESEETHPAIEASPVTEGETVELRTKKRGLLALLEKWEEEDEDYEDIGEDFWGELEGRLMAERHGSR